MPCETGPTILDYAAGKSARIRVATGPTGRRSFPIAVKGDAEVSARAALLDDMSKRLQGVVGVEDIVELLKAAGEARTAKQLQDVRDAVELVATGKASKASSARAPTVAAFAGDWTSGRLRKAHPDHVREKNASGDVQIVRDYIEPVIGDTRLPDVRLEHAERVMGKLPATLAPATRKAVAQCLRKILSLAVYPGRHISSNPIPLEWMPKVPKSARKAKSCLYPADDAKLMACVDVLLERRLAYGILMREGPRASELGGLRWRDLDLEHGRVRLDANKTDDPRAWALSPDVVRVLVWWKKRTKGGAGDLVLPLNLKDGVKWLRGKEANPKHRQAAELGDLKTAGVDRAELFERSKSRQPIRLHDLRATFVTVSLANGRTEQWVTDRTGHKSSQMIALYSRQARTWAETNMGPFRPLDELLPEMAQAGRKGARSGPSRGGRRSGSNRAAGSTARSISGDLGSRSAVNSASPVIRGLGVSIPKALVARSTRAGGASKPRLFPGEFVRK